MDARLSITTLGDLSIRFQGEPITSFSSRKVEALLVYLAVEKETAHRRESLFTLLWPGMPEASARHNLRQVLYALRQSFPEVAALAGNESVPLLLADRNTVQINPQAWLEVDVHQIDHYLEASQVHDHLNQAGCEFCLQAMEQVVDLYAGDFLRDFYLEDSNAFEDWAAANREAYRAKILETLATLTEIFIQKGAYDQAQTYAEQQLKIDPLRERAYRQLMELLSKSGQRAEALRVYQQCARVLEIELGTHPSRETTALFEIIRGEDVRQSSAPLQEGSIRGYEIREHLGRGHAGAVYRAYQPVIGRDVAIKVILPQFANHPDFIRRFEVEAQLVARLEHPYIVPLYDYWRDPSGAYLVMRWLKGGNLHADLARGPWKPTPAIKLVDQICAALALAHRQGVVHCDIKPANILLDEESNAYLTDFGIAILTGPLAQLSHHPSSEAGGSSPGSLGYSSPEAARGQPPTPLADIYSLGVVLFELLCGVHPFPGVEGETLVQKHLTEPLPSVLALRPELPETVDAVIQRATQKDPHQRYPDVETLAQDFRLALAPESAPHPEVPAVTFAIRNPYKGLRPFAEADAVDFFGREDLVSRLLEKISPTDSVSEPVRFLAVVGPSGSGKSSVVKAGLIPAIRRGAIPGSESWFVAEMTPGSHPLEELETALLRIAVKTPDDLLTQLASDPRGLLRAVRRALPGVKSEVLLVIDQFEELFTLVADENERNYFLDLLAAAVSEPHSRLRLVITLRADFYDRPLQHGQFGELVRSATEVVLPLTPEELERAICGPAELVGGRLEPALVARILQEVGDQPGALPLLQYALTEIFELREDNQLTLATYEASGGILGALGRRAEEIFSRLTSDQQGAARQMFLRLVTLGEGTEDVRRRVLLSELSALKSELYPDSTILQPLEVFGRYRLLTFDHDPATRAPTVEVAHEALLREWPRLRGWLDESRDDIRMQRLLRTATLEWLAAKRAPGFLLRGARLDQFALWMEEANLALTADEQAYLSASLEARAVRKAAEAERQAHEAQLEQRSRRFLRALVGVFAVAAVIAILLSGVAFNQSSIAQENAATATFAQGEALVLADSRATQQAIAVREANARATQQSIAENEAAARATQQAIAEDEAQQRAAAEAVAQDNLRLARANELGTVSLNMMEKQPDLAFLLSVEAFRQAATLQNWTALYRVGTNNPRLLRVIHGHQSRIEALVFSPDGKTIASGAEDGTVRLWDMDPESPTFGNSEELPLNQKVPPIEGLAFSPDGHLLAASTADGRVLAGSPPEITHVLFWNVDSVSPAYGQLLMDQISNEGQGGMSRLAFSPTDPILAVTRNERVEFLDADPHSSTFGQSLGSIINPNMWLYLNALFSPDGTTLAIGGIGEAVTLWRVNPQDLSTSPLVLRTPFFCCANGMAYSLDGKQLFFGGDENYNIMVWDVDENSLTYGEVLATLSGHEWYAPNISLSPDGKILASAGSRDATVRLWDVDPESATFGQQVGPALQHGGLVDGVAFNPDGTTLVVGTGDGNLYLWDMSLQTLPEVAPGGFLWGIYPEAKASINQFPHPLETVLLGHTGIIESVAFSPDGKILASGGGATEGGQIGGELDGTVRLWDADPDSPSYGQQLGEALRGHTAEVVGLAFAPDGSRLASCSWDGTIRIWDVGPASPTFGQAVGDPLQGDEEDEGVSEVAFSPDGRLLAATYVEKVYLWDVDPNSRTFGQPLAKMEANGYGDGLAFSPDGQFLAYAGSGEYNNGTSMFEPMQLWNVDPESPDFGQLVLEFQGGHSRAILRVKYHPNGKILASAGGDDTIRLWNVDPDSPEFGQTIGPPMVAQGQDVYGIAFSPDGKFLASATIENGKLQLWDTDPASPSFGQPMGVPLNPDNIWAISIEYSPDGKYFAVGDVYHRVHLWNVDPLAWKDYVCRRAGRNLAEEEWNLYLSWAGPYNPDYKTCPQWP